MWKQGQSGNLDGRRIKADDDWLPGETQSERARRRNQERAARWRENNPNRVANLRKASQARRKERWDEFLADERARYAASPDRVLERQRKERELDPEKVLARGRRHYQGNKHKYVAGVAARRAARLQATPPWVNKKEILAFYAEARRLTKETGIPHEVDHIHPLRCKQLCGLHVPWNLQVIPRVENRKKHNRYDGGCSPLPAT